MADETWIILKADIEDIKNKLSILKNQSTSTANKMTTDWSQMAKNVVQQLGLAFGLQAIIRFGKESQKVFVESELSSLRLSTVLKNIGVPEEGISSIKRTVDELGKISHFDTEDLYAVLGDLVRRFGDVKTALQALPVIVEGSRAGLGDLNTTADKLALGIQNALSGIESGGRGLKEFGITVTKGKTATDLLNEALQKISGSATAFDAVAGGTEALNVSFQNLKETIGGSLNPAVQGFAKGLATQIALMLTGSGVSDEYNTSLKKAFSNIGAGIGIVIREIVDLTTAVIGVFPLLKDFFSFKWGNLKQDWGAIVETLKDMTTGVFNELTNEANESAGGTSAKITEWENNLDSVLGKIKGINSEFGDLTNSTGKATKDAEKFKSAWSEIIIQGVNVPELTKFVGNLRQATVKHQHKVDVNFNLNVKGKVNTESPDIKKLNQIIDEKVKAALSKYYKSGTYFSHGVGGWSDVGVAAGGTGGGAG